MALQFQSGFIVLGCVVLGWTSFCSGQSPPQNPDQPGPAQVAPQQQGTASDSVPPPEQLSPGSINGTVLDQSGAVVTGARLQLTGENRPSVQVATSGNDGEFFFPNVAPGPFQLTITSAGLETQTYSGILHSGEVETVPQIRLLVARNVTEVQVGVDRPEVEVAEEQVKVEEKQRVLGAIPNFYVSYVPNAAAPPLNSKQKFELAWKSVLDPFTFVVVGGNAGVQQWQNHFKEYGQGAQGYAKRFAAGYGDTLTGTFIGDALLPSLLKQDPRYFYKGTGSRPSRFLYAIAMAVVCRGDNRRWQPNYSGILGSLAAGGISNLYYPPNDRDGAELTFENAAVGIASSAASNLLQEFLIRKLTPTPKAPKQDPAKP